MRLDHAVLGNRELLIVVLAYLEGEDVFYCAQVCYLWKTVVASSPGLEIKALKFSLYRSNLYIARLTKEGASIAQAVLPVRDLRYTPQRYFRSHCYSSVERKKVGRRPAAPPVLTVKQRLCKRYRTLKEDLGITFHYLTDYRFFQVPF